MNFVSAWMGRLLLFVCEFIKLTFLSTLFSYDVNVTFDQSLYFFIDIQMEQKLGTTICKYRTIYW